MGNAIGGRRFLAGRILTSLIVFFWVHSQVSAQETRSHGEIVAEANRRLGLAQSAVVQLSLPPRAEPRLDVSLEIEGRNETVTLAPHSIRSSSFRVVAQTSDGSYSEIPTGPVSTLRGKVVGRPGSVVVGSLLADGLHARIVFPDGGEYWVEPIAGRVPGARANHHVVYRGEDALAEGLTCAAAVAALEPEGTAEEGTPEVSASQVPKIAEIACDADFEFFLAWGSVANVQTRIENIINSVNIQYERDVAITHVLGTIIVRTADPDPYSTTDAVQLARQFRDHWQANHSGIHRDIAHLFTGRNLDGGVIGIAWLNSVCTDSAYGLSQSVSNYSCATDLTAHEMGHLWGAFHCSCANNTMNTPISCTNSFAAVSAPSAATSMRPSPPRPMGTEWRRS